MHTYLCVRCVRIWVTAFLLPGMMTAAPVVVFTTDRIAEIKRERIGQGSVWLPAPRRAPAEIESARIGQRARRSAGDTADHCTRTGVAGERADRRARTGAEEATGHCAVARRCAASRKSKHRGRGKKQGTSHFVIFLWLIVRCVRFGPQPAFFDIAVRAEVSAEQTPDEPTRISVRWYTYGDRIDVGRTGIYSSSFPKGRRLSRSPVRVWRERCIA